MGFTISELIVVMGVLMLLLATTLPVMSSFMVRNNINTTVLEIKDALERAKMHATTGYLDENWGVHFDSDKYVLFYDDPYNPNDPDNEDHLIPAGLTISTIDFDPGNGEAIFEKGTGIATHYGFMTITDDLSTTSRTVTVNAQGLITES